jgi:hypothetical protein
LQKKTIPIAQYFASKTLEKYGVMGLVPISTILRLV